MRIRHRIGALALALVSAATLSCGRSITAREARARLHPEQPPIRSAETSAARRPPEVPLRDVALAATLLQQPRRQIVEVALAMTGAPSKGIDCSSFAQRVYAVSGQRLPRTVSAQLMSGTPVAAGELQPGDLIFFAFEKRTADHVGIYTGEGSFVHVSSRANGVRVESLDKSVFANARVASRRYVR